MAYGNFSPLPQTPINALASILPANTTTDVTVFTAGADGAVIEAINLITTDTVAPLVSLKLVSGANTVEMGRVRLASLQGADGISSSVNAMDSVFALMLDRSMLLGPGVSLRASVAATLTAATKVDIVAAGFTYTAP